MAKKISRLHRQILGSLKVYEERGEFDGSLASARECLELAEYEWTPPFARATRAVIASQPWRGQR